MALRASGLEERLTLAHITGDAGFIHTSGRDEGHLFFWVWVSESGEKWALGRDMVSFPGTANSECRIVMDYSNEIQVPPFTS